MWCSVTASFNHTSKPAEWGLKRSFIYHYYYYSYVTMCLLYVLHWNIRLLFQYPLYPFFLLLSKCDCSKFSIKGMKTCHLNHVFADNLRSYNEIWTVSGVTSRSDILLYGCHFKLAVFEAKFLARLCCHLKRYHQTWLLFINIWSTKKMLDLLILKLIFPLLNDIMIIYRKVIQQKMPTCFHFYRSVILPVKMEDLKLPADNYNFTW